MGGIILNNLYQLDQFLTKEYFYYFLRKSGFHKRFKIGNANQLFAKYRNLLMEAEDYPIIRGPEQNFNRDVQLGNGQFYTMSWDVNRAEEMIKEIKMKPKMIDISIIKPSVLQADYNEEHLDYALENQDPIIIGYYPQLKEKYVIIDGVHRVTARYKNNIKKIPAYDLQPSQHLQVMNGRIYQVLFKIHYNYLLLVRLSAGVLPKEIVLKKMYRL